jgi:hypothetical protein
LVFSVSVGFVVACLPAGLFHEFGEVGLSCFGFDHIGFVAGCEDEVAFVFAAVEVEAFYIIAGVA